SGWSARTATPLAGAGCQIPLRSGRSTGGIPLLPSTRSPPWRSPDSNFVPSPPGGDVGTVPYSAVGKVPAPPIPFHLPRGFDRSAHHQPKDLAFPRSVSQSEHGANDR